MKFLKYFGVGFVMVASFFAMIAYATGNIIPTSGSVDCTPGTNCSQFRDYDSPTDADIIKDRINWNPTSPGTAVGAVVTNTAITGNIWGESVGWINLSPDPSLIPTPPPGSLCAGNIGVKNTCSGVLSGCAFGENASWINFKDDSVDDNFHVTINPTTGAFSGHAWSENYGFIKFDCSDPNSCVKTTWAGCSTTVIPPTDPTGPSVGLDLCVNLVGNQASVPPGYIRTPAGYCYQTDQPVDMCLNLVGNQTSVPPGYVQDGYGNCYFPTIVHICSDGIDNDHDGHTDYPSDPGCTSPTDDTEENPDIFPPEDPIIPVIPTIPGNPTNPTNPSNPTIPGTPTTPGTPGSPILPPITSILPPSLFSVTKVVGPIGIILSTIGLLSTIPGFAVRLGNFLIAIPLYRRRRPWGIVYDAETKEPLDPVYVTVYDDATNNIVDTKITDINGRYGFLLSPGTYRMVPQKTHYQFPSTKLPKQSSDGVYDNLYFGEVFTVTDDRKSAVIVLNMPMDKLAIDWNQEEKKRIGIIDFFTRNTKLWATISLILFILGFIFSVIVMIISPSIWNTIVFILYIIFTILQLIGVGPIRTGTITDQYGKPIQHAIVRVWNAHLGTQIGQRITNEYGDYYILVSNGDYYMTIDVKNASGTYDRIYTSETITTHQGIINKSITI